MNYIQRNPNAGLEPLLSIAEQNQRIAAERLRHAAINCELQKARATVRAKMMIQKVEEAKNAERSPIA